MYWVYILKSIKYPKTYVGITDNLVRRLIQHNEGYHFYTKRYVPWQIIYKKQFNNRLGARKQEKYLKSSAGRKWINRNLFK